MTSSGISAPRFPAPRVPAIRVLLRARRPSAVAGFVIAVIVDAVECHSGRSFSHISSEVLELQPAFADSYSATAVKRVGGVPGVEATRDHPAPGTVCTREFPPQFCALPMSREGLVHLALRRCGKNLSCALGMMFSLHRMRAARVVAALVFADAIAALIHRCKFPAAAGAGLRLQWRPVLYEALRLGDAPFRFFRVMTTPDCHSDSLYQPRGEYN